ncbi:hypothetical protein [Methanoplanus endosymbiosus]|uniref:Transposase n=1 Tax=Methanoplanus endosymbiosus TaxID=33865 RepID=A0A9E7PST7_9EURY|nr:hypothetical protein [Methanoplanus endosymbiosus]UUX93142.1 hypothetical protein L6E24_03200 [Methanoplanus endosymbiosus]
MMNDLYERIKLPDPQSKLEIYTDGNDQYLTSLNALYANPCVNYGQLIKVRKKGRVEEKYKIAVIGEPPLSKIETTDVENSNGILRERVGRLVRKAKTFSKLKPKLESALDIFQFYWNFMNEFKKKPTPRMIEGIIDRKITWPVFLHSIIKYVN